MRARTIRRALLTTSGAAALLVAPALAPAQTPSTNTIPPRPATADQAPAPAEDHDYTALGIGAGVVIVGGAALVALRRRRTADVAPRDAVPRPPAPPRSGTERDTMR